LDALRGEMYALDIVDRKVLPAADGSRSDLDYCRFSRQHVERG
jgi:hypothetical protein